MGTSLNQFRQFLPTGPSLTPYLPLAPATAAFLDLLLGLIVIGGLFWTGVGALQWTFSGGNIDRRSNARERINYGLIGVVGPFVVAAILAVITYIIGMVQSMIG